MQPDVIIVSDTDYHIDHVSLSQSFDYVMGRILREQQDYQPAVYKGFCYDYAWYANDDFYNYLTLQSAVIPWNKACYNTAFAWDDRIRFPLPPAYLSYTLHSSKLRTLLLSYHSQRGITREGRLLNSDKVLWERRTDTLWADVTASSGDASLLQDFLIGDTMEAPLANCWIPDSQDTYPEIQFSWPKPQTIAQLVFYDAPAKAGDIQRVRITDDSGFSAEYTLPNGEGKPCRFMMQPHAISRLTITVLQHQGEVFGFSEIEILPQRTRQTQWIQLMDQEQNFLYEAPCPAGEAFPLLLYGYPAAPAQATATITSAGRGAPVAQIRYDGHTFPIPPLAAGRYTITIRGDQCSASAVLRVGDSMLRERIYRFVERSIAKIFPD